MNWLFFLKAIAFNTGLPINCKLLRIASVACARHQVSLTIGTCMAIDTIVERKRNEIICWESIL